MGKNLLDFLQYALMYEYVYTYEFYSTPTGNRFFLLIVSSNGFC